MGAVVENTLAQWGAIGVLLISGGWLVRYLTGRLAAVEIRREKREDELLEAYRENTELSAKVATLMAQVVDMLQDHRR